MRSTSAILASDRLMAGRMRWRQPCIVVMVSGMPSTLTGSARPEAGSQPSHTAKVRISIMPSQKLGSEKPSTELERMPRPSSLSRYRPATSPSGTPTTQVSAMAMTTSSKVAGMRCAINWMVEVP